MSKRKYENMKRAALIIMVSIASLEILVGTLEARGKRQLIRAVKHIKIERKHDDGV